MTTFTEQQKEMMQEIASMAKIKGIQINTKEDLDELMQYWIKNNFSANYLGNEYFKMNADRQIKQSLNLN